MPPDVYSLLLSNLQETRREMNEGFKELRHAVTGYDAARCEAHTDRMTKIESRQDTERAAREAMAAMNATARNATALQWAKLAGICTLASTLGALATLALKAAGLL